MESIRKCETAVNKYFALTKSSRRVYKNRMAILTAAQAAERLGVSVRRVQQLVKSGRLPAGQFGGALMIEEKDLKLVENRKVGRPPKARSEKASKKASGKKGKKKA
jgi:excisionase family DNA binding protein